MKISIVYSYYNEFEAEEEWGKEQLSVGQDPEKEMAKIQEYYGADLREIYCQVELMGGRLDLDKFEGLPKDQPSGCGVVVFVRSSHGDGHNYNWRVLALPKGVHNIDRKEVVVGDDVNVFHSLDSNSDVVYHLPVGSWEFVAGKWVPRNEVAYSY